MSLLGSVDAHDVFAWEGQNAVGTTSAPNEGAAGSSTPTNMVPNGSVTFGATGFGPGAKAIQIATPAYLRTPNGTPTVGSPALDITGNERCDSILAKISAFNPGGSGYTPLFNRFHFDQPDSWSDPYGTGIYVAPGGAGQQFLYYYVSTSGGVLGFPTLSTLDIQTLVNKWVLFWGSFKGGAGNAEIRVGVVYRDSGGVPQSSEHAVTGAATGLSLSQGQHGKMYIGGNPTLAEGGSGYFSRARSRDAYPSGMSPKAFYEALFTAYELGPVPAPSIAARWLRVNGVEVPTLDKSATLEPVTTGPGQVDSFNGTTRASWNRVKRRVKARTTPVTQARAWFLECLMRQRFDRWSFDSDLLSDKGIAKTSSTSATQSGSGGKYAGRLQLAATTGTITWPTALGTKWTAWFWTRLGGVDFHHYLLTSDGNYWIDGAGKTAGSLSFASVSSGALTLANTDGATRDFSEVLAVPAIVRDDMVADIFAFTANYAAPLAPALRCMGRFHVEALTMLGDPKAAANEQGYLEGSFSDDQRQLTFELTEQ